MHMFTHTHKYIVNLDSLETKHKVLIKFFMLVSCLPSSTHTHTYTHIHIYHTHLHTYTHSHVHDSVLVNAAAMDCLSELNKLLGRMIMRGRVEQHNPQ